MSGPYLSVIELLKAPTGIDWSSVPVRNATPLQQAAEARRLIQRATSWANGYCGQVLWATREQPVLSLSGRYIARTEDGYTIFPPQFPVNDVIGLEAGSLSSGSWSSLGGNAEFEGSGGMVAQVIHFAEGGRFDQSVEYGGVTSLRLTYIAGYANAHLLTDIGSGVTTLPIDDGTGFHASDVVTIYDGDDQEDVVLAAGYVAHTAPLTLAAPTTKAHLAGISVSEMAESIREAVLLYTTDLVRERGKDAVALLPSGGARLITGTVSSKIDEGKNLLNPYVRRL